MRRQDQVVTKIELLDRVWDASADTDPNVVEVYVGYLRRKIDQPFGTRTRADGPRRRLPAGRRATSAATDRRLDALAAATLRARLMFLSTAGLAVGLAIGGLLIVGVLHLVLIRSVDSTTRQTVPRRERAAHDR